MPSTYRWPGERAHSVGADWATHALPSWLARIVDSSPTACHGPPPNVTPRRSTETCEAWRLQVAPSFVSRIVPSSPAITPAVALVKRTPRRSDVMPPVTCAAVQDTP